MTYKRVILLVTVILYACIRGCADKTPSNPSRILVVQMAKLGDMVCTTPVFSALRQKYKHAEIWVLGNALNRELLQGNPEINGYIAFDGIASVREEMRAKRFDVAVIAGAPDFTSTAVAFLSGIECVIAPNVVGVTPLQDIWYRLLLRYVCSVTLYMGNYIPREYLRLLEPLGIAANNTKKTVVFSKESEERVVTYLDSLRIPEGSRLVGVLPGAGNKIKRWLPNRFAEVIHKLNGEQNAFILIMGGKGDMKDASEVLSHLSNDRMVANVCGIFSLDETKAVIKRLDLLVGVDTGPIYIAEALGTPTVDIVGPVNEMEQAPQGEKNKVVIPPPPRKPEISLFAAHSYSEVEVHRQLCATTSSQVVSACVELLTNFARYDEQPKGKE